MSNLDAPLETTPYSEKELEQFKKQLLEEQKETEDTIKDLRESVDSLTANQTDESSASAHHQGDIGSEEDEREKFLAMIEKENNKLNKITAALDRIELGTYGICEQSGKKIQKERLKAIPFARYSMEAKENNEKA